MYWENLIESRGNPMKTEEQIFRSAVFCKWFSGNFALQTKYRIYIKTPAAAIYILLNRNKILIQLKGQSNKIVGHKVFFIIRTYLGH